MQSLVEKGVTLHEEQETPSSRTFDSGDTAEHGGGSGDASFHAHAFCKQNNDLRPRQKDHSRRLERKVQRCEDDILATSI